MPGIFAIIDRCSPFYSDLAHIFGTPVRVPLVDARVVRSTVRLPDPGAEKTACGMFFKIDIARMSVEQVHLTTSWLSARFGVTYEEVQSLLNDPRHGIPLHISFVVCLEPEGTQPLYPLIPFRATRPVGAWLN